MATLPSLPIHKTTTCQGQVKIVFLWNVLTTLTLLTSLVSTGCSEKCSLPESWKGTWFINEFANIPPAFINTTANSISRNTDDSEDRLGQCILSKDDFYIFTKNDDSTCNKCVLIIERHENVLYSKEGEFKCASEADRDEDPFKTFCSDLIESEREYFWFKTNYKPIKCPLVDSTLQFSYSKRGGAICKHPVSHASSCIDNTKLNLQYEACHDNENSVGLVEQLTCVGNWNESGYWRFVADVSQTNTRGQRSFQERFRCFIYTTNMVPNPMAGKPHTVTGYTIGTFDAATCKGLHEPDQAETILHLKIENPSDYGDKSCSFPKWLAAHHWMDMGMSVKFEPIPETKNTSIYIRPTKRNNHDAPKLETETRRESAFFPLSQSSLLCLDKMNLSASQEEDDDSEFAVLAKYIVGCKIDEICLHFLRRSEYVFQLYFAERLGMSTDEFREKCFASTFADLEKGVTMISTKGSRMACPFPGKYLPKQEGSSGFPVLIFNESLGTMNEGEWSIGCDDPIDLHTQSSPNDLVSDHFSCTNDWNYGNSTFTILSSTQTVEDAYSNLYCMRSSRNSEDPQSKSQDVLITSQDCIHISENMMLKENEIEDEVSSLSSDIAFSAWLYRSAFCNRSSLGGNAGPLTDSSQVESKGDLQNESDSNSFSSGNNDSSDATISTPVIYMTLLLVLTLMVI